MTIVITQRELRNDSGRIMRELDAGVSFVVTRNGTPVGELRPLRRHRFVDTRTALALLSGGPSLDLELLRADLDKTANQELPDRG